MITLPTHEQLIVVVSESWDCPTGTLYRMGADPIPVALGKKGLAWGAEPFAEGPLKREGDGKSPAGFFRLGPAFGKAASIPGCKLAYRQVSKQLFCVDDPLSADYNRLVYGKGSWKSAESMDHPLYTHGLVIQHNWCDPEPHKGSCIFMHLWEGDGRGTAGCTAMSKKNLLALLTWLDPAKNPLLVQLPRALISCPEALALTAIPCSAH